MVTQLFLTSLSITVIVGDMVGPGNQNLPHLRFTTVQGTVGRFVADRRILQGELHSKGLLGKQEDVGPSLPTVFPNQFYDLDQYSEVLIAHLTFTDTTLQSELPPHLQEEIATSFTMLAIEAEVVFGQNPGFLPQVVFVDGGGKLVFHPYLTNYNTVTYIDKIEKSAKGIVTLREGTDVMVVETTHDVICKSHKIGKNFDKIQGLKIQASSWPWPFDWGCEILGRNVTFCEVLDKHKCTLQRMGANVCTVSTAPHSERCTASMRIVTATGIFLEAISSLVTSSMMPIESFQAEWIDREHITGIKFPCMTGEPSYKK